MKDISSACVDSGGKGYAMNQEADKTLNIIRKFTRNRPEYPVNNKQENALRPCGRRPLRKPYLWIKKIDPSRRELLQELRAKRGKREKAVVFNGAQHQALWATTHGA